MKAFGIAIFVALLLNVLAAAGLVGWLYATQRLDRDRAVRILSMFEMTIDQEKQETERLKQVAQEKAQADAEAEHYRRVSAGPQSVSDRLKLVQQAQDITTEQDNRRDDDINVVRRNLDLGWEELKKQRAQLDAQRKAFEQQTNTIQEQRQDQAFQQAVTLYESIPAKQARSQFLQLIAEGQTEQVVDYLAAMNKRKAVGVLSEFKTPADIPVAADLLERLRKRGDTPPPDMPAAAMTPADNSPTPSAPGGTP